MYDITLAQALHKKYAPSQKTFDLVYTHCLIVHDIASQLITSGSLTVDKDIVLMGALLHDIGVYSLLDEDGMLRKDTSYVRHGVEGEKILAQENFPTVLQRIASHHTGVGISKNDIRNFQIPLPEADYMAKTKEELLVMYADKFHSKSNPPHFNSYEWYYSDIARFGEDKPQKFKEMADIFGVPNLRVIQKTYNHPVR